MASADFSRNAPAPAQNPPTSSTRSEAQALEGVLRRLATQRNRRRTMREIVRALGIGAALCAPLLLLHRLYILDLSPIVPLSILGVALIIGAFLGWRARVGSFEAARDADAALGLEDRLASALSIAQPQAWRDAKNRRQKLTSSTRTATPNVSNATSASATSASATSLVPALLQDAAQRAATLDPKTVYPAKFDTRSKWCLAALALLLAFTIMPDWDFLRSADDKKLAATLTKQGAELEQIAKPILKKNDIEASAPVKKLAARMDALARRMQRGRMNRGQALLGIGELKRDLEKAAQNQSSTQSNDTKRLQDALKNADMQSDEGKNAKSELQKNDVENAADQLEKLADKIQSGDMTREEKQKAANDLEKAAKALRENGQSEQAKKLEDAAKSLRQQAQGQQGQQQPSQQGAQKQQNGQQKNGDKQQGQQNGQQNKKSDNGQKGQGQKSQNGGQQQNQNGQKSQSQQQGGQQQGQNGGQKSQSQQNGSQSQNGQNQGQQGQQGKNGQSPNGQQGDSATQGGSQALRDMANGMRGQQGQGQGGGNSKNLQDMLNKIKEAERNSGGQNSGQSPSQGQMPGNGSMPGQNGQSVTPGKDLMPSDPKGAVGGGPGLGSRNNATGVRSGGGVSKLKGKRTGDKRRWDDVWSDRLPKTRKQLDKITGKMGSGGEMEQLQTQTEAKGGKASAPYYDVYESYKKDAEDAVAREAVPPAYKQPVKDYFESLKP